MQIRNQERRLEEVVPFSEVAKYLSNALSTPAAPAFGRANSAHPPSSHYGARLAEEGDIVHEDSRECRSLCMCLTSCLVHGYWKAHARRWKQLPSLGSVTLLICIE